MDNCEPLDRVDLAIADVYAAFADVPRPSSIAGCLCCLDDKDVHGLLSTPLRELEPKVVGPYASSVFLTVGDTPDFFYLLPRILEILATERHWWPDPEVVGRAIRDSGFPQWPARRREAVTQYLNAVFDLILRIDDGHSEVDSWLCMLGSIGFDLCPYLDRTLAFPDRVADLFANFNTDISRGRPLGGFWESIPESANVLVQWLRSDPVRQIIHKKWGVTL
jgi:hypothetical protein